MMTANIIVKAGAGTYSLVALFDGAESAKTTTTINQADSIATLNLYQNFNWTEGMSIQLQILIENGARVTILKGSSWSMSFIGELTNTFKEFSSFLSADQDYPNPTGTPETIKIDLVTTNNNLQQSNYVNSRGQFVSNDQVNLGGNLDQFQVDTTDLFYVSMNLIIDGPATDLEAVMGVSLIAFDATPEKGIGARFSKLSNSRSSISLSGIFIVRKNQYLSFFINSVTSQAFTVSKESFISVVNMRYIVSSVSTRFPIARSIQGPNWYDIIGPFETQKDGLYSFGKDFNINDGRFTASHSGVHSLQANIQFEIPSDLIGISTNKIELEAITDDKSRTNGLFAVAKNPKSKSTLRVFGVVNMRAGETVRFRVRSGGSIGGSYTLTERSSLSISYIGPVWAVKSFHSMLKNDVSYDSIPSSGKNVPNPLNFWKTQPDATYDTLFTSNNNLFDATHFTADEDGIYVVSALLILNSVSCGTSGTFKLALLTSGGLVNNFDQGFQHAHHFVAGSQGTEFTLALSTAIRLQSGFRVALKLEVGSNDCSYTIKGESSFSVAKWSEPLNTAQNPLKYIGVLARLSAPTNDQPPGVFVAIGANTMVINPGDIARLNYRPGVFGDNGNSVTMTGKTFNPGQSDLTVEEPGIFFISGILSIESSGGINGQYEIVVQIDGVDVVKGLYATVTEHENADVSLTFAGTVYLKLGQRVRVAVRGAEQFVIVEGSSFSLVKLQPDYKTPGIITGDVETIFTGGTSYDQRQWRADTHVGLTVGYVSLTYIFYNLNLFLIIKCFNFSR